MGFDFFPTVVARRVRQGSVSKANLPIGIWKNVTFPNRAPYKGMGFNFLEEAGTKRMTQGGSKSQEAPALSHTRVKHFETCPMSYRLRYIERVPTVAVPHLDNGIVLHRALELLVREAVAAKHVGPLNPDRGQELLRAAWAEETAVGVGAFADASEMVAQFIREAGDFDSQRVLAVEQPFSIPFGRFTLNGVMDRVDRIDHETIEITDYKTGAVVPTADEVRDHLQLSIYQHAASKLWPWAKTIKLTLHMVRHNLKLRSTRTASELARALAYVWAMGTRIETAEQSGDYPPRMSPGCSTCMYRLACPAYASLLQRPVEAADLPSDIDEVAKLREHLGAVAKAAEGRKQELDAVLRSRLDGEVELQAGGRRYFIRNTCRRNYGVPETIGKLSEVSGLPVGEVVQRLTTINNQNLNGLLKELGSVLPKHKLTLLRAELDAAAERTYVPQLWSKTTDTQAAGVSQ